MTTPMPELPIFGRFTEDGQKLMDTPAAGGVEVVRLTDAIATIEAATLAGRVRADELYARFTDRCKIAQQCITESRYKDMVVALHNEMLKELKP